MFLFFEGFQPQEVLILSLFSMKHYYTLKGKSFLNVNNSLRWFIGDIEYLNATYEGYKVIYLDGTSDNIKSMTLMISFLCK